MSGDLIDITDALEKRKFKEQDERLARMRDAFRAARTGSEKSPQPPAKGKRSGKGSGKGRNRPR